MKKVHEVLVPDIGDAKDVGVIEILVQVGETVVEGQTLIIVETDKASMEIPSPHAGILQSLVVKLDDKVSEGSPIAFIEADQSAPASSSPSEPAQSAAPEPPVAPIAPVAPPAAEPVEPPAQLKPTVPVAIPDSPTQLPLASPSVRKFSRELGVSLEAIQGSGPRSRITKEDVSAHVKRALTTQTPSASGTATQPLAGLLPWPVVDFAKYGPVESKPLSRIKKISGANLHRNWVMIPHVTNHDDADITQLERFRIQVNKEKAEGGVKITLLALLMKACASALKKFPEFNASLNGDELILKRYFHIGFAADTPEGLVVPVIRDVDQKGVLTIAQEMSELAAKARAGKLSVAEMTGGCFSISSLGGIGGTYFTPIINAPEVAILGVGKSVERLALEDGQVVARNLLPLSLSWDHRVIDGATAGRFNAYLCTVLADYRRLVL
ncbi:dihydrolipoyllysine-residue acetyltransferase [Pseudomonas azerbaijanoccidens]|uniref:dihydrolipoyllysine-residue acetyltransferase n=1 Tax=Pseudomonas azerbaijanoccidentalis TaxID=2842347 RepID=UPI00200B5E48|nr:dihydrolipoyllysine-residue acetyltransferase [Pseudomonas azerbaijanoccidentalis]MCK8663749.1 dihydrolipoyllysine-residue acetyltransferase [Pseudomonas azerbaijanoccidentalis]